MSTETRSPRLLVAEDASVNSVPRAPSALLLSSYRDLRPAAMAPQHAKNVVLSYDEYQRGWTGMHLRRQPMGTIRLLLHHEWPREFPGPGDPRDVPCDQRSARWAELCEGLGTFRAAGLREQTALLGLCSALGYFGIATDLGMALAEDLLVSEERFTDEHSCLFLLVAGSALRTTPRTRWPSPDLLLGAVRERAMGSMRLLAHANLVAYLSWSGSCQEATSKADALAREWRSVTTTDSPMDGLAAILAILAGGWALARQGETSLASEQVNEAWERIEDLDHEHDAAVAHVRRSVTEARVVLSFRLGDAEKALEEHRSIAEADLLDAQACAERGLLAEAIDPQAALASYRQALRLGVPMTEYVSERLGDVLTRMGDLTGAYDAYASAAVSGASRISALSKLAKSAEKIGQPHIARWALEQVACRVACQSHDRPGPLRIGASVCAFPPSPVLDITRRRAECR